MIFLVEVVLCCCCGGFEATEPNGLCEYCVSLCLKYRRRGEGCRVLEALRVAERRDFPCSLYADEVCPNGKRSAEFVVFGACYTCPLYREFMREMDEEEEQFFDEVDKARKGLIDGR